MVFINTLALTLHKLIGIAFFVGRTQMPVQMARAGHGVIVQPFSFIY